MLTSELHVENLSDLLLLSRLYKVSAAVNAAAQLDVFSVLSQYPEGATLSQLSTALGLCPAPGFRGGVDLLDLLVSVGCLHRQGSGPDARYSNTPITDSHLVKGRPQYCGGILVLNAQRSLPMWTHIAHALRHGQLPQDAHTHIPDIHTTFGSDAAAAEFFAEGMTGASLGNFQLLASRFPFPRYSSVGDLGGSAACLAVTLAAAHPHLTATSYDLPPVREAAERAVAAQVQDVRERVKIVDYDFFSDKPVPGNHDVLVYGMVLHDWGLDKKMSLLKKAYRALPPGGALIAVDHLVDDERTNSAVQLGMSLTMLLEFWAAENAFDYSFKEFTQWVLAVGFSEVEVIALVGTAKAAVAYKGGRRQAVGEAEVVGGEAAADVGVVGGAREGEGEGCDTPAARCTSQEATDDASEGAAGLHQ